ncbi:hypothetical protein KP79_PYT03611 [Mizuhopecten yessoensis]|uniref:Uncharacterized protein n=1 Tax=Mizuhopecten yessoensis TaxID=6573 RepID=A0A210PIT0_MIZYE|nr:hypothetical protein KP79_PYT03611 [Mizuhopecten yessoensis]
MFNIGLTMSPTLYWMILGTLLGFGICVIGITYIICRFRKPKNCWSDPGEEILQETETITESEITATRHGHRFPPTIVIRRESLKTISTRTSARAPKLTCVSCGSGRYQNMNGTLGVTDTRDKVTNLWNTGSASHGMMTDVAV